MTRNAPRNLRWQTDAAYREKGIARASAWKKANPKRAAENARRRYKGLSIASKLLSAAKHRAKKAGIAFAIVERHVVVPATCPILGLPLICGIGKWQDNSPTLDRIDNTQGYVPGNVMVISWRANRLKCDAAPEEIALLHAHMQKIRALRVRFDEFLT